MSSSLDKMAELAARFGEMTLPENADGEAIVKDESGAELLRLGFTTKKDIITKIGFLSSVELPMDIAAALASLCIAEERAIMSASLIGAAELEALLSDDGHVNEDNLPAVQLAYALLHEALRNYSMRYNEKRARRLAERDRKEE